MDGFVAEISISCERRKPLCNRVHFYPSSSGVSFILYDVVNIPRSEVRVQPKKILLIMLRTKKLIKITSKANNLHGYILIMADTIPAENLFPRAGRV